MNNFFYNNIKKNDNNRDIIEKLKEYSNTHSVEQLYLITAPLGQHKYSYTYEENAIVILSPTHKIIFLDLNNNQKAFKEYYEDFIEDLGFISDKFDYKKHIGRARVWKKELTTTQTVLDAKDLNIEALFKKNEIANNLQRTNEFLISLLIRSINDIETIGIDEPETILEKVKHKIVLFDGEQTRFIYKHINKKCIYIQGLSGTGKTELLLHKLKEIYLFSNDSKIFFTCHSKTLANTLKKRVPDFFNFMKVAKQIEWNERLWLDRAWGAVRDKHSGLYSYICHFYNIHFHKFSNITNYEKIFTLALEKIERLEKRNPAAFEYAFDYIIIDERQDFPEVFFKLCEKITRRKVYIAGDIFQNIYERDIEKRVIDADFILNICYRTDPRTLMFAHAIGMGLFEDKKLNWLTDKEWEASGYKIQRYANEVHLYREPVRRFQDLELEDNPSMSIQRLENLNQIIDIIKDIRRKNHTLTPDDIAIIIVDPNKNIYNFMDKLESEIMDKLHWKVNKSYVSNKKIDNTLFVSNKHHAKGLEFPFVICITSKIKDDYQYRNTLYTMLTRSFIQSYLLVKNDKGIKVQQEGLNIINQVRCIKIIEPSHQEKETIKTTINKLQEEHAISYKDFLNKIFNELNIESDCREKLENMISEMLDNTLEKEAVVNFIKDNEKYC